MFLGITRNLYVSFGLHAEGDIIKCSIEPCAIGNTGVHHTCIVDSQVQGRDIDESDIHKC